MFRTKPRIICSGIDGLQITVELQRAMTLTEWDRLIHRGPYEVEGASVALTSRRKDSVLLQGMHDFVGYHIGKSNETGHDNFRIIAGARTNAVLGTEELFRCSQQIAAQIFGANVHCRVSSIDLYVDMQDTSRPDKSLKNRVNCRAQRSKDLCEHDVLNVEGQPIRTMRWGDSQRTSDSIVAVYYEKPSLKAVDWRVQHWQLNEQYDPGKTVRRLEFRVRGPARFASAGVKPEVDQLASGGLNTLWTYLTEKWFRLLATPKTNTRKKIKTHRWWKLVQDELPLAKRPVLDRTVVSNAALQLDSRVKQAAGHLRKIAGLSDSEEDCKLAQLTLLDAAQLLIARREESDSERDADDYEDPLEGLEL
ncbi:MAG: hypothetical protein KDB68_02060 [Planctomycetes bacterium]|nr:hypothetical protein [Planctomycetota bacterium]